MIDDLDPDGDIDAKADRVPEAGAATVIEPASMASAPSHQPLLHWALLALRELAILAALLITIHDPAPTDTIALRGDKQIIYIERGLTGTRNPQ